MGGGLTKLLAAKDDTKLLDADAGRILLRDPAKKLLVLNAVGEQVGASAERAACSGAGGLDPDGTTLRTYDVATASSSRRPKKGAQLRTSRTARRL